MAVTNFKNVSRAKLSLKHMRFPTEKGISTSGLGVTVSLWGLAIPRILFFADIPLQ